MIELVLPIPPSTNQYWRAVLGKSKSGKTIARNILSKQAREYHALVKRLYTDVGFTTLENEVEIIVEILEKTGGKDIDNYLKGTLDALTNIGVWVDDSQVKKMTVFKGTANDGVSKVRVLVQEINDI